MSFRTLFTSVVILASLATTSLAGQVDRLFRGWQNTEYTYVRIHGDNNELVDLVATGTGYFTHMGRTTYVIYMTLNLVTGEGSGTSVYTAADGAELHNEFTSQAISAEENIYDVTTIGGTGRFENATGNYQGRQRITSRNDAGGTASSTWTGVISY